MDFWTRRKNLKRKLVNKKGFLKMKLFDLTGKVALVTGGNGGIGLAMAKAWGEAGAKIVVAGSNQEKNDQSIKILQSLDMDST